MAWFWWLLVIGVIAIWVMTAVDLIRRRHAMSGGKLAAWVLLIIILPAIGSVLYFLVNSGQGPGPATEGRDRYLGDRHYGA